MTSTLPGLAPAISNFTPCGGCGFTRGGFTEGCGECAKRRVHELEARVAELEAALGRVRTLCEDTNPAPAADSLVLAHYSGGPWDVDIEVLYQRTDVPGSPRPDGDWFEIGRGASDHPVSYGEVLGLDNPIGERSTVTTEVLVPASTLRAALTPRTPCTTCGAPLPGLLASCTRPICRRADIAHDARMARLEDQ